MTGKQIADNLSKSRLPWGRGQLYRKSTKKYCVLGIKLKEAGIPQKALLSGMPSWTPNRMDNQLEKLVSLNDGSASKQSLISKLRKNYAVVDFPIEEAIEIYNKQKEG